MGVLPPPEEREEGAVIEIKMEHRTDVIANTLVRMAEVERKFELVLGEVAVLRREAVRRARKAKLGLHPPTAQLCSCACEDDPCLNCPNSVAARWDAERRWPAAGFGLPSGGGGVRVTVPTASVAVPALPLRPRADKKRVRFEHVNRPESAGEEDSSDEEGGRRPRSAVIRKLGCFPTVAHPPAQPATAEEDEMGRVFEQAMAEEAAQEQ